VKELEMKIDLHIHGAFETLAARTATDESFLEELRARGHSIADSRLILEKGLLEGLLERTPSGLLCERGSLEEAFRNAGPDDTFPRTD
jgi:hypothetical protein